MVKHLFAIGLALPLLARPAFETATVKHVAPDHMAKRIPLNNELAERGRFQGGPGSKYTDRIEYSGVTLKMLLKRAYDLKGYQISGPAWIDTERYDVVAKLPPGTNQGQLRQMLQSLLTERFQLQQHRSSKRLMAYRLTIAKGGPKLLPPQKLPDGKQQMEEARRNHQERVEAWQREPGRSITGRSIGLGSSTTEQLAESLSYILDRPVKDDTKIEGLHAFRIQWVPEDPNAFPGPNIFMAVEEQLGLKLEGERQMVEMLVIDTAEQ